MQPTAITRLVGKPAPCPDNLSTLHVTTNTYDANGNQLTVTDWRENTNTNIYDPLNRLIEKQDSYGKTIETLDYNKNSVQIRSSIYETSTLVNITEFRYDLNNKLISTKDPEGHMTLQGYDSVGNITTKTDGRGNVTTYRFDPLNRLSAVENPVLAGADPETTSYTHQGKRI